MFGIDRWIAKGLAYGVPLMTMTVLLIPTSCGSKQKMAALSANYDTAEHSPSVLIVMYDQATGKGPLLKAIKDYKAEIVYDYNMIAGMAIKKPNDKTLEETRQYFKKVKGVVSVEYDHIYHLTDPIKPKQVEQ